MDDLNKRITKVNQQIRQIIKQQEKETARRYARVLATIRAEMAKQYEKYEKDGKLSLQEMLKFERLKKLNQRMEHILTTHYKGFGEQLKGALGGTYQDGYYQTAYNLEMHIKKKIGYRAVRPETLKAMLDNPINGLTLNQRLQQRRAQIIQAIQRQITIGLQANESYSSMAKRLKGELEGDAVKAMRIVRTEGHRVQESAKHDAMDYANSNGVIMMKQWNSLEDERVRGKKGIANHRILNNKKIAMDQLFDDGLSKGPAPGQLPAAASSINCRCFLTYSIEKVVKKDLKDIEAATFEQWKKENIKEVELPKEEVEKADETGLNKQTKFITDFKDMPSIRPRKRLKEFATHEEGMAYREERDKDLEKFKQFKQQQIKEFKEKETFFKTQAEAEKYIKANILHPKGKMNIEGVDLQIISGYCRMFDVVAKDFPQIKNSYIKFDNFQDKNDRYVMEASSGIHFGNHRVEELFENMMDHAQSGYTIGNSIYNVFLHEIGHWVDRTISQPPTTDEMLQAGRMDKKMGSYWQSVFFRNSGIDAHVRKMQALSRDDDTLEQFEKESKEFLSEYSAYNTDEMFAELFSASYTEAGDKKPIVVKFRKWLKQVSEAEKKGLNKIIKDDPKTIMALHEETTKREGLDIWYD